jgi:hypothetical protein
MYISMRTYEYCIRSLSSCIRHDKLRYAHQYASTACRLKTVHLVSDAAVRAQYGHHRSHCFH